jgi:hypothetical protein
MIFSAKNSSSLFSDVVDGKYREASSRSSLGLFNLESTTAVRKSVQRTKLTYLHDIINIIPTAPIIFM